MSNTTQCHEQTVSLQPNPVLPSTSRTSDTTSNQSTMPVNNNTGNHSSIPNGHTVTESVQQQPNEVKARKKLSLPVGDGIVCTEALPPPRSSWLLRLFESKLFEMSIAIAYLFKSKEPGVLTYLGNKLFVSISMYNIHQYVCWPLIHTMNCSNLQ